MPGLGFNISIRGNAPESVQALKAGLAPAQLNPIVGRAARNVYREHLFGLNDQRPNALGGARTNFYAGAARATQFRVEGDHVIVSINQVGIALRYFGGTVKPVVKKYLTIPAIPEAHGKRASEFTGLHFSVEKNPKFGGALMPCLVEGARSLLRTRRVKGSPKVFFAGEQQRRVVFWLVRSATFKPDPTVLPYPELVESRAAEAVNSYAKLLWERQQPPSNGGDN